MGIYLKILAFSALIVGLSVTAQPKNACASGAAAGNATQIAPQTCDTNVWADMTNRARIETEREIMQNQNLIFKPDSVLAYTCFDSLAAHTAARAGVLFTHTTYWNPMPLQWGSQYGMDTAVNNLVIAAMRTYITSNFNHSQLGGRGGALSSGGGGNAQALAQYPVSVQASQNSQYACGVMGQVWAVAKCLNFLHTAEFANTDGYYPFINLQGFNGSANVDGYEAKTDVRHYPTACSGQPLLGSDWLRQYRAARNEVDFGNPNQNYQYGEQLNTAFRQVRDRIAPVGTQISGGRTVQCGNTPAIPTGVTVILGPSSTSTQPYPDGVCTNPGCTYSRNNACVNSIVSAPSVGPGIGRQ